MNKKNLINYSNKLDYAPIALFVFNRPRHVSKVLESLASNPEFLYSPLFIYSDGAKNISQLKAIKKVRNIIRMWPHPNKTIIESETNMGLANSIISGVTYLTQTYGRAIIVEDDLILDKNFLYYLNSALLKYKNNPKIMQISAYMFPIPEFYKKRYTLFFPNITSWGWATWERAWSNFNLEVKGWESLLDDKDMRYQFDVEGSYMYSDMLFQQINRKIDSWAIRWNWTVFKCGGLVSYPPISFVKNNGFDRSGTHCGYSKLNHLIDITLDKRFIYSENIQLSMNEFPFYKNALRDLSGSKFVRILKDLRSRLRRLKIKLDIKE